MKLQNQEVVVHLTEDGHRQLRRAGLETHEVQGTIFDEQETDELGLWVSIQYEEGPQPFLVKWNFVIAVDVPLGPTKSTELVN